VTAGASVSLALQNRLSSRQRGGSRILPVDQLSTPGVCASVIGVVTQDLEKCVLLAIRKAVSMF